jgi:hypothetical protein
LYFGKELNIEISILILELLRFSSTIDNNSTILGMATGHIIYVYIPSDKVPTNK